MPRIVKLLPQDRADYSFGDLLYWHLFEHGTHPNGDPSASFGQEWDASFFCELVGISDRTLYNWLNDRSLPFSTAKIAHEFFGDNPLFDAWRKELAAALKNTRAALRANTAKGKTPGPETDAPADMEDGYLSSGNGSSQRGSAGGLVPHVPEISGNDRKSSADIIVIPPSVYHAFRKANSGSKAKATSRRVAAFVVPGVALLIGVFAWANAPSKPTKSGKSGGDAPVAVDGPIVDGRVQPPVNPPPPNPPTGPVTDPDKDARERANNLAKERRKAEEARKDAERQRQLDATKAALDQKKREDEANAQAMNAKLKALAQADGNDFCRTKLEGLSVPGFTLKCDTLIPFGDLLGSVPVSQTASSLADCAARCRKAVSPKCVAFSFDAGAHTGSASCYLTGSIPAYNNATNWIAGTR